LLLRRAPGSAFLPGMWVVPGGHVELGESLQGALLREVREEAGIRVQIRRPISATVLRYPVGPGRTHPTVWIDFLCRPHPSTLTGVPRLCPEEHCEYVWATSNELARYPTSSTLAASLRAALSLGSSRGEPEIR